MINISGINDMATNTNGMSNRTVKTFPQREKKLTALSLKEVPSMWNIQYNGMNVTTARAALGIAISMICITDMPLDRASSVLLGWIDSFNCILGQPPRFHHWKWIGNVPSSIFSRQSQQKLVLHTGHFI
mmetsp:Transcript_39086/g.76215  ORF Transcript_39086/g.76215 Transcript_39086/m.76215 type:complete len:129 (+) Transcript_39086:264-650(+)